MAQTLQARYPFFYATYEKVLQRMWNVSVLRQHVCVCVGVKICPDGGPTVQPWGPPVISHKPHAHAHNHHTHTTVARPNWRTGGTQGDAAFSGFGVPTLSRVPTVPSSCACPLGSPVPVASPLPWRRREPAALWSERPAP